MSKRTSSGKAKDKGASLGRGGRGGSSSASRNGDQFADDRGNIREYLDMGIRPSSRLAGSGDSSSAENYEEYLEESMLDIESEQHRCDLSIADTPHTQSSLKNWSDMIDRVWQSKKRGFVSEYITMRAKNVAEKHSDMMEEMYGEDNSCHPRVGDREIWERVCGGPDRKRRFFGFGSLMDIDLALTLIMEYLVKLDLKARILELKQRYFED
ncbi:hypothetical protein Tco_0580590 [Tanacetum coccineum]